MRKQKQVTGALACSLSWAGWGQAPPLNGLQVGEEPWVGPERWLRWSAHPSCRSVCGMVHSTLFWLTILQSWQLGFSSFCILLIICPNCVWTQLFLLPYRFFCNLLPLASVQRCWQLFPFLPLELSRAAFILLPRHAWGHMETPPPCDCFHTFLGFKEYQLRTAYWSRVGNPPWQSNLQLMKECWGVLPAPTPTSHLQGDTLQTRAHPC